MEQVCSQCMASVKPIDMKVISVITDSQICRCCWCGAFWMETEGRWELLLSSQEACSISRVDDNLPGKQYMA
ncbi:hypothetical protein ACFVYJ_08765 [Pontibacter sp. JAM-7]|uniref:hypothetical protein n=1 Tax=Pontibacter sp. JAM-7 TaxID=3366581 RepID=UPI003AF7D67C